MNTLILAFALILAAAPSRAYEADPWPCQADADRLCRGVTPGEGRVINCLKEHFEKLSQECRAAASGKQPAGPPNGPKPQNLPSGKPRWNGQMNAIEYDRPQEMPPQPPANSPEISDAKVEAIINKAVEKAVKQTMAAVLPREIHYRILHHQSKSNTDLQITDYCNWAVYRKWDRQDVRSYAKIRRALVSEFDIFERETTCYY